MGFQGTATARQVSKRDRPKIPFYHTECSQEKRRKERKLAGKWWGGGDGWTTSKTVQDVTSLKYKEQQVSGNDGDSLHATVVPQMLRR